MDEAFNTSLSKETSRIYWQHAKKYKLLLTAVLISRPLYLFSAYVGNVYVTGVALDKLRTQTTFDMWQDFGGIIIALIGFVVGQLLFEYVSVRCIWTLESRTMRDLANLSYERLMNESADFHANRFSGSLVSQVNKFVGSFDRLAETLYWQVYSFLVNMLFALVVIGPRLPAYAAILCVLIAIFFYTSIVLNKKGKLLNTKIASAENHMTGQLADSIGNILAVKSFAQERPEQKRFQNRLDAIFNANMEARRYHQRKDFIINVPVTSATILAVVFSIVAVSRGIAPLSTILLATVLTRDIFMRARDFNVNSQRNIARAFGDAHDMMGILLSPSKVKDIKNPEPLSPKDASLQFKNVDFKYIEEEQAHLFKKLNFTLQQGQKVGLVGPSGGGKTTVTKLLLRFMDISGGEILLGGQNIANVAQQELRAHIAYVPQEPLLFHRSLAENISYGTPTATTEDIKRAAKLAHADEFIDKLPAGYETLVGERGVKLSGGQKQRVAIARAILKDAPILILDEATSALDSESEIAIQAALKNLMKGKTTIVIAHRLSTIQHMDRIIVMEEGTIIEEGTHNELKAKKNGLYARLWSHQSGGFLQD